MRMPQARSRAKPEPGQRRVRRRLELTLGTLPLFYDGQLHLGLCQLSTQSGQFHLFGTDGLVARAT